MTHVFPILVTFIVATACATGVKAADWTNRTRGLLIGSLIGDALGGPFEFQPKDTWEKLPFPPKVWKPGERMTGEAIAALRSRVRLNPYGPLRPVPESYAHWLSNAAPGTITDDSRNKMVLLHCVERTLSEGRWPVSGEDFAREFVEWPRTAFLRARTDYKVISNEWLEEFRYSARWILGERDPRRALPPERMWNSLPTCCGQMMFPPLAAVYPGQADKAYLLAWNLGWVDNGFGRDMNATLVAALAMALTVEPDRKDPIQDWNRIARWMRETDPWRFSKVNWCERAVDRWLRKSEAIAGLAGDEPHRLFQELSKEFAETTAWEAQVPLTVVFASAHLCKGDPLATLALTAEWGQDTDSYPQLAGAFIGALHGPEIFPAAVREQVEARLSADYGESLDQWIRILSQARDAALRAAR